MRAQPDRRWVIGQHHYAEGLARGNQVVVNRFENFGVDFFHRENFVFQLRAVSAFVRRLHVNVNVIVSFAESGNGGVGLAFVVGVYVAGCAGDVNGSHTGAETDAFDEVNGRNHGAFEPPFFAKVG